MSGFWHERHERLEAFEKRQRNVILLNAVLFLVSNAGAIVYWNHDGLA